ncbi:MAG: hypothetical protein JSS86_00370 [Cyanobacteria bacterium SZAS LIN-2]|nr:hypothetical protein [Cyanobacteria bacterium SZAS LIN-3]MBS1994722.1 hypothetical protein [Cyanobacteria bacterium SZAS LIN-2]
MPIGCGLSSSGSIIAWMLFTSM